MLQSDIAAKRALRMVAWALFLSPTLFACIYLISRLYIPDLLIFMDATYYSVVVSLIEIISTITISIFGIYNGVSIKNIININTLCIFTLIFIAIYDAFFSATYSTISQITTMLYMCHLLYGLTLYVFVQEENESFQVFLGFAFAFAMLPYIVLLVGDLGLLGKPPETPWLRAMPGFANVRQMAHGVVIGIAAVFGFVAFAKPGITYRNAGLAAAATLLWALLFWSGSRGGVFALLVALPLTARICPFPDRRRFAAIFVSTAVIGAALSTVWVPPSASFGLFNSVDRSAGAEPGSGRLAIWRDALRAIADKPLLGHGAGQFKMLVAGNRSAASPHNIVLQVLFDWGIVGAILFFVLLASLYRAIARKIRNSPTVHNTALFYVLNCMLAYSLIDTTFYHSYPLMVIAGCFAALAAAPRSAANETASDFVTRR